MTPSSETLSPTTPCRRPALLFLAHPITGHLTPTLRVASALHARGWDTYFLGPTTHRARIEAAGPTFLPLQGKADLDDLAYYSSHNEPAPAYWTRMKWYERALVDFEVTWVEVLGDEWRSVREALAVLKEQGHERGKGVVVVCEALFLGVLPMFLGAMENRPRCIALSVTVPLLRGEGLPPFGYPGGMVRGDQDVDVRARNEAAWRDWAQRSAGLKKLMDAQLREAGVQPVEGLFCEGQNYVLHDRILQLGVPGFFFPRNDWPSHFAFAGMVPKADVPEGGWKNLPAWWDNDVVGAREKGHKVVVVAQGTVEVDARQLVLPTMEALADRDDMVVVAILGRKGASLPLNAAKPGNARVADYLAYEAALQYAHVWVHNGGYGAVQCGVAYGVPMVVAGEGQDKGENGKRVSYSGIGVDLGTAWPGVQEVREGVRRILEETTYRQRVEVLRREDKELGGLFDVVENTVLELAGEQKI